MKHFRWMLFSAVMFASQVMARTTAAQPAARYAFQQQELEEWTNSSAVAKLIIEIDDTIGQI